MYDELNCTLLDEGAALFQYLYISGLIQQPRSDHIIHCTRTNESEFKLYLCDRFRAIIYMISHHCCCFEFKFKCTLEDNVRRIVRKKC